jgi:hypothetical protein
MLKSGESKYNFFITFDPDSALEKTWLKLIVSQSIKFGI